MMRWECAANLKPERERWGSISSVKQFYRQEKRGMEELRCANKLDYGSLTRMGLLEERVHPGVAGEDRRTEERARLEERQKNKNRPSICLRCVSKRPCAWASSWKVPKMLRALDSTESRRHRCHAGVPAHSPEHYSIERQTKAL